MIRRRFAFAQPETLDEAVRLLAEAGGRGRVLGGGSVLVSALSAGLDDPASDAPPCLVALDASFRLESVRGSRLVPATGFCRGAFDTERAHDEIATELVVPAPPSPGRPVYLKLKGAASSWLIVSASCLLPGQGRVRLCLGAAATVPVLKKWPLDEAAGRIPAMAREAADAIGTEWTDELAGPGYRRAVAGTVAGRALRAVIGAAA